LLLKLVLSLPKPAFGPLAASTRALLRTFGSQLAELVTDEHAEIGSGIG
jgi:hypothetical protein